MSALNGPISLTPEQAQAQVLEITRLAQSAGFGNNVQAFLEARNKAKMLQLQAQAQQNAGGGGGGGGAAAAAGGQTPQNQGRGGGTPQPGYNSPSQAQMQLKLPAHAVKRLGTQPSPAQQKAS